MKKILVLALVALLLLAGCGKEDDSVSYLYAAPSPSSSGQAGNLHGDVALPAADGDVIEIKEKLFIAQTNDIYINYQDYLGKTVRYQGLYKNSADWDNQLDYVMHYVIRYGPGCCGYDGEAGFEVRWDGEWPEVDDWVEVVGTIYEETHESGMITLYVDVASLEVKTERGAEYVAT